MQPQIQSFFDPETHTITHVVACRETRQCAVIDPVLDYDFKAGRTSETALEPVRQYIRKEGLTLQWVLETHAHADHLSSSQHLRCPDSAPVGIGAHIRDVQVSFKELFNLEPEFPVDGSQFQHLFEDGESFGIGHLKVTVMHTPGHTPACVTYCMADCAFVGDTLFMPDYGTARCDFPGGDARILYRSIQKILALPDQTRLFLCHDYLDGTHRTEYAWETTVAEQKAGNIHVHEGVTEEAFVALREARDASLDMPLLLLPSIQVNIRAGDLPPPEGNGIRYLKIPLNVL